MVYDDRPPSLHELDEPASDSTSKSGIVGWKNDVTPTDHGPATSDIPQPPNVPGGGGGASGSTAVNTPSLTLFASNMDALIQPLNRARTELAGIDVRAGAFHQAFLMDDKISSPEGLKGSFDIVLRKLIETVTDIRDGARKMAADYDTTEEANKATAEDLAKAMPDLGAWRITNIGNGPNGMPVPPPTTGGGGGGDIDALINAGSGLGD